MGSGSGNVPGVFGGGAEVSRPVGGVIPVTVDLKCVLVVVPRNVMMSPDGRLHPFPTMVST